MSLSYMPGMFAGRTVLLDNLHDEFPAYGLKGPESFGKFLEPNEIEKLLEERWVEVWPGGLFWAEGDEPSLEECQEEGRPNVSNG